MDESLFKDIVQRWVSTANATLEEKREEADYLYKSLLRETYSADKTFSAVSGSNNRITADVVAMDSDLPLKSRGSMETYSGKIPKIGLQRYLSESQLSELDTLQAKNVAESIIAAKIFDDYTSCVIGSREKVEFMTHQMLSNGIASIESDTNTGAAIRVDYGIPEDNRLGVETAWNEADADIAGDLERVYTTAVDNGHSIALVRMDRVTFNQVRKNASMHALYNGFREAPNGTAVTLNLDKINEMLQSEYGFKIEVIDRSFQVETSDGVKSVRAWEPGAVSFWATEGQVGDLVYADLAEKSRPVKTKTYSEPEPWLLAAKWSEGNPLREFSEASGLVMPVLKNVDQVYFLDTATPEV